MSKKFNQVRVRSIIFAVLLFVGSAAFSQKPLSQQAINELVNKSTSFLGLQGNEKARAALNRYFATYNRAGAAAAMASLKNDLKGRDDLIMIMNRATSSREMLSATLTAMSVNPQYVSEVTEYFFPTHTAQKPVTTKVHDTGTVPPKPAVKEEVKPVVWVAPSKKFFDGRKAFCDSTGTSYYTVVIIKDKVLVSKYTGKPTDQGNKGTPDSYRAVLNGEEIVQSDGSPTNYRYENNFFLERAPYSEKWTRYTECKE